MRTHEEVSKQVFDELIAINVNEHTEKKGNLTYLSWAWAYVEIMKRYPTFNYRFDETEIHEDGTVTVHCTTQITVDGHDVIRTMWLPVMDYKNMAIAKPNSMSLNTAKMRCLTKCISMHGLGSYIYAGEDLPEAPAEPEAKPVVKKKVTKKVAAKKEEKVTQLQTGTKYVVEGISEGVETTSEMYIKDEEGAVEVTSFMIMLATDGHADSMESLVSFWQKNANVINYLSTNHPEQFTRLKDTFTEIKTTIMGDK
jgi:hypothetical protein